MNIEELLLFIEKQKKQIEALKFSERKDLDNLVRKTEKIISELEMFEHLNHKIPGNFGLYSRNLKQDILVASKLNKRFTTGEGTHHYFRHTKSDVLAEMHSIITELIQRVESARKKR